MSTLSSDNFPDSDLLGRTKFALQIVQSLINYFSSEKESITVGICGKWGSGKSTLLRYIEEAVNAHFDNNNRSYKVIRFNPWSSTNVEETEKDFIETVLDELQKIAWKKDLEEKNNIFKSFLKQTKRFKFIKHFVPVTGGVFDAIDEYIKDDSILTLSELKKKTDELITESGIKLFIIIDDIDRLESESIIELFKTIKQNLNFTNTTFLIAYDKDVVVNALKSKYHGNADNYLEKIIQADFVIPEILAEKIESIFFQEITTSYKNLFEDYEIKKIEFIWKYCGLKEYFNTLRDIKRYFNSLFLSINTVINEVNHVEYFILEAIKVFDFDTYVNIYRDYNEIQRKAVRESIKFETVKIKDYSDSTTRSLLTYLFEDIIGQYNNQVKLKSKRFKDPSYFSRYYSLGISNKDTTEQSIKDFFTEGNNIKNILNTALNEDTIDSLLQRLSQDDLYCIYSTSNIRILANFLDFWDSQIKAINNERAFLIWKSYFRILDTLKPDKHKAQQESVRNILLHESRGQFARFIFNFFLLYGKHIDITSIFRDRDISTQFDVHRSVLVEKLKLYLINQHHSFFVDITLGDTNYTTPLLIRCMVNLCETEYELAFKDFSKNDTFSLYIIRKFLIDFMYAPEINIVIDNINIFIPLHQQDDFFKMLSDKPQGTWNEEDTRVINYFVSEWGKNRLINDKGSNDE